MNLKHCRSVLVYGGSFDPPHMAHVLLPGLAMEQVGADAIAYVPAGRAPHKPDRVQTPAIHRLAMLRLALENSASAFVLTHEVDRATTFPDRPSFTVDTLAELRRSLGPSVELRLLIGADMVRIFDSWREPDRIRELAAPVAMVRPPDTVDSLLSSIPDQEKRIYWRSRLIKSPQLDVSSTMVRERAGRGASLFGLVPPGVEDYIRRNGLYRGGAS